MSKERASKSVQVFAGLKENVSEHALEVPFAEDVANMTFYKDGTMQKRFGDEAVPGGPVNQDGILVASSQLFTYDSTTLTNVTAGSTLSVDSGQRYTTGTRYSTVGVYDLTTVEVGGNELVSYHDRDGRITVLTYTAGVLTNRLNILGSCPRLGVVSSLPVIVYVAAGNGVTVQNLTTSGNLGTSQVIAGPNVPKEDPKVTFEASPDLVLGMVVEQDVGLNMDDHHIAVHFDTTEVHVMYTEEVSTTVTVYTFPSRRVLLSTVNTTSFATTTQTLTDPSGGTAIFTGAQRYRENDHLFSFIPVAVYYDTANDIVYSINRQFESLSLEGVGNPLTGMFVADVAAKADIGATTITKEVIGYDDFPWDTIPGFGTFSRRKESAWSIIRGHFSESAPYGITLTLSTWAADTRNYTSHGSRAYPLCYTEVFDATTIGAAHTRRAYLPGVLTLGPSYTDGGSTYVICSHLKLANRGPAFEPSGASIYNIDTGTPVLRSSLGPNQAMLFDVDYQVSAARIKPLSSGRVFLRHPTDVPGGYYAFDTNQVASLDSSAADAEIVVYSEADGTAVSSMGGAVLVDGGAPLVSDGVSFTSHPGLAAPVITGYNPGSSGGVYAFHLMPEPDVFSAYAKSGDTGNLFAVKVRFAARVGDTVIHGPDSGAVFFPGPNHPLEVPAAGPHLRIASPMFIADGVEHWLEVFRTNEGDLSTFYKVRSTPVSPYSSGGALTSDITLPALDSALTTSLNGSLLGETSDITPSGNITTETPTRAWFALNENTLAYSTYNLEGVFPVFKSAFTVELNHEINALASLDDKVVVFSDSEITVVYGDGPNDDGSGAGFAVHSVATDVGCAVPGSVVTTPNGVMFYSDRGVYLLDRAMNVKYISGSVEATLSTCAVEHAAVDPTTAEVRFTCYGTANLGPQGPLSTFNGNSAPNATYFTLAYNYEKGMWTRYTGYDCLRGQYFQGTFYKVPTLGTLRKETNQNSSAPYAGSGSNIALIGTPWVRFGNRYDQARISRISLVGKYYGPSAGAVDVTLYVNDSRIALQTFSFSHADLSQTDSVADKNFVLTMIPKRQEIYSIRLLISETGDTTERWIELSSLDFEYSIEGKQYRLQSGARRG